MRNWQSIPIRSCRLPTTLFKALKASPGESGIKVWLLACWLNDEVVGASTILILREAFRLSGLTVRTESNDALSKAPEGALEAVLEEGLAILKELFLDSSLLSILACFDARRCGCGMLNDVLRLRIGSSESESDSVSPSSHNAGYWCLMEV